MYTYTKGHSRIAGTGIYLPEQRVTTRDLMREIDSKARFGVSEDWLERVTGIREKRTTPLGILPSDMAVAAAKEALERAKITPKQIDAIIYAGLTRDHLEPATAHVVQAKLGATNATVFDVSNACHGFMNAVHILDALIATGQISYGLAVTGEQGSVFTNKTVKILQKAHDHRRLASLAAGLTLGDAGAAMVLRPKTSYDTGFMGLMLQSQGQHATLCTIGTPDAEDSGFADMPSIVEKTAKLMAEMFQECMYARLKWRIEELAKYLVHQVGGRTFDVYNKLTGVPKKLMPRTVDILGNLVTASIPLGIYYCDHDRELSFGDKIYISSTGSGISLSQAGLIWDSI